MSLWSTIRHLVWSPWVSASLAFGFVGTAAACALLVRPDLMLVEQVAFEGVRHARPGALRHLTDIRNGTTIWSIDLEAAARGVERHPWVRSARASRQWPDTVTVEVEEYVPVAILHYDDLYYVDADGLPFLRGNLPDLDFPNLTGIEPSLERRHPGLPGLATRDALALLSDLDERGLAGAGVVSEIAFSETRGFTVHIGPSRVLLGLEDIDGQLDRLSTLVERGEVDLSEPTWVDLAPASVAIVRPLDIPGGA